MVVIVAVRGWDEAGDVTVPVKLPILRMKLVRRTSTISVQVPMPAYAAVASEQADAPCTSKLNVHPAEP